MGTVRAWTFAKFFKSEHEAFTKTLRDFDESLIELQRVRAERNRVEDKLDSVEYKLEDVELERDFLKGQIESLQNDGYDQSLRIADLENEVKALREENYYLENSVLEEREIQEDIRRARDSVLNEYDKLTKEHGAILDAWVIASREVDALKERSSWLELGNEDLEQKVWAWEDKYSELEQEYSELQRELEETRLNNRKW